jgi:hypothetical protein
VLGLASERAWEQAEGPEQAQVAAREQAASAWAMEVAQAAVAETAQRGVPGVQEPVPPSVQACAFRAQPHPPTALQWDHSQSWAALVG